MRPEAELLLSRLPRELYRVNGVPEDDRAQARDRAAVLVEDVLSDLLGRGGLVVSPLGPAWSTDIDVYLLHREASPARLRQAGWLPLDGLLERIGSSGSDRWLVMDADDPLVIAHLHVGVPPEPVSKVLSRARRRGEVRLREVLELLTLQAEGHWLPPTDQVIRVALPFAEGADVASLPVAVGARTRVTVARGRRVAVRVRRALRPRLGVAISGVDGAGKSTVSDILLEDLGRAGIPAERVWTRPGLRIGMLVRVGRAVKRVLRDDPQPAIRRVGQGEPPAMLRSRRGVVGWAWSMLVTCSFVLDIRRRQLAGRGILVYDRHVLDALATLRFVYDGVDTRLQEAVVSHTLPKALATFYLAVPADVAHARKQDDVFGAYAVSRQLEIYATLISNAHVLDAQLPPTTLAHDILTALAEAASAPSGGRRLARNDQHHGA